MPGLGYSYTRDAALLAVRVREENSSMLQLIFSCGSAPHHLNFLTDSLFLGVEKEFIRMLEGYIGKVGSVS